MGTKDKLIKKFKDNPASLKYSQIEKILLWLDFEKKQGAGSHVKFFHKQTSTPLIFAVHNNDCIPVYKEDTLKKLKKVNLITS